MDEEEPDANRLRNMDPRLIITKIFIEILSKKDEKLSLPKLVELANDAEIPLSLRQTERWISLFKENGTISRDTGSGGRRTLLDDSEIRIIIGFILERFYRHEQTTVFDVQKWIKEFLSKNLTENYIWKLCNDNGIHYKMIVSRGPDLMISVDARDEMHRVFINALKAGKLFNDPRNNGNIFCIDFTYNSQRTTAQKSLSPKGQSPPKSKSKHPPFTNCFIVANSPNGSSLPTICYTHDPIFDTRIEKNYYLVQEIAQKINSDQDRIVFVKPKKKTKYCKETSEITKDALDRWGDDIPFGKAVFISDDGSAFKNGDQSVFDEVNAKKHIIMPSEAHAHISTCDSGVNRAAKNMWRNDARKGYFDITKEPESTLWLLKCFDLITETEIKAYWDKNFDLKHKKTSFEQIQKLTKNVDYPWANIHSDCLEQYQDYMNYAYMEIPASSREQRFRSTGLNGPFYETPTKNKKRRISQTGDS